MTDGMTEGGHQQRDNEDFPESERSLMKTRKGTVPHTLPSGAPAGTGKGDERTPFRELQDEINLVCIVEFVTFPVRRSEWWHWTYFT